jgi:hypothetical protein
MDTYARTRSYVTPARRLSRYVNPPTLVRYEVLTVACARFCGGGAASSHRLRSCAGLTSDSLRLYPVDEYPPPVDRDVRVLHERQTALVRVVVGLIERPAV